MGKFGGVIALFDVRRHHPPSIRSPQTGHHHAFLASGGENTASWSLEIPARAERIQGPRMATIPRYQFALEICGGAYVNELRVADSNLILAGTLHDKGHSVGPWIKILEEAAAEI